MQLSIRSLHQVAYVTACLQRHSRLFTRPFINHHDVTSWQRADDKPWRPQHRPKHFTIICSVSLLVVVVVTAFKWKSISRMPLMLAAWQCHSGNNEQSRHLATCGVTNYTCSICRRLCLLSLYVKRWSPVYTIQPVVKPVWQPVGCLFTRYSWLSHQLYNRLYRVNGV